MSKIADAAELTADATKGTLMTQAAGKVTGADKAEEAVRQNMMKQNPQLRTNAIVNASRSVPFRAGRFVGNGILGMGASYATDQGLNALGKTNLPGLNRLNTESRPTSTFSDQVYNNFADSARAGIDGAAYGAAAAPFGLQGPGAIAGAATGIAVDTGTKLYGAAADTSKDDVKNIVRMVTGIPPNLAPNIDINGKLKEDPQKVKNRMLGATTNVPVSSFGKTPLQSNIGSTQPTKDGPEDLGEMSFNMNQGK